MLYSGHKESGLIRISLSIGLGGPGWARGLYMDKKQRSPARLPCLKWNMPLLSPPGRSHGVRAFVFGRDAFDFPGGHQISGSAVQGLADAPNH